MDEVWVLVEGGILLAAIALAGGLFRWLKLSAIPGFILLGLVLHRVIGESEVVELAGIIGVVLLLFFMGLEFSFRALVRGRKRLTAHGIRDLVVTFPVGLAAGLVLGWGLLGALLLAAAVYVSSSAIIAKSLIELRRTAYPETEAILSVLVFEDLVMAVLVALLSGAVLAGGNVVGGLIGAARALGFFAGVVLLAVAGRPILDRLLETEDDDLFVLLAGGAVLILSGAAVVTGLSEAIGAFLAGTLIAETDHKERTAALFAPLQGVFAALFFVSFGLSIDVAEFAGVWLAALVLAALAIVTKLVVGWWIGRADGLSPRASFSLGVALIPRGEFSIILAGIAVSAGIREARPLIALLVLILAVTGTVAIRYAPGIATRLFGSGGGGLESRRFRPDLAADGGERQA